MSSLFFDPWTHDPWHDELLFHPGMFFDWDPARPAQRSMLTSGGGAGGAGGGAMLPLSGLTTSLADPGNISNVGSRRYPNTLWLDVFDRGDSFVIEADVPGVDAKDVDLKLDQSGTILNISATRRLPEQRKGDEWRRHERDYGKFRRTVRMPPTAAADQASAKVEFGVLKIVVPKKASGRIEGREREREAQPQAQSKSERERERELERARADELGRRASPATAGGTSTGTTSDTGYERERERGQRHAREPERERERGRWSTMEESEMDAPSAGAKHGDKRSWDEPSLSGAGGYRSERERDDRARHWDQPSQASSSSSSRGGIAGAERDTLSKGYGQSSRDRDRDRWERDRDEHREQQERGERERGQGRESSHSGGVSSGGKSIPISTLRVSQPQPQAHERGSIYAR